MLTTYVLALNNKNYAYVRDALLPMKEIREAVEERPSVIDFIDGKGWDYHYEYISRFDSNHHGFHKGMFDDGKSKDGSGVTQVVLIHIRGLEVGFQMRMMFHATPLPLSWRAFLFSECAPMAKNNPLDAVGPHLLPSG